MPVSAARNPGFIRILVAQVVSTVGNGLYYVAVLWWVKVSTGSKGAVAIIALCGTVPQIILGPVAGVTVDRASRRGLMLLMDISRACLLLVPAFLLAQDRSAVWQLCIVSVLNSSAGAFFNPAFGASIPAIVAREELPRANSLSQTGGARGGLVGPALGGILVAAFGAATAMIADAATFGISALLIALSVIPSPWHANGTRGKLVHRDLIEGLAYFWHEPLLGGMTLLAILVNFCRTPIAVLLPGIATDVLHADAAGYGILESVMPAGFMVGGLALMIVEPQSVGKIMLWLISLWGVALVGLGASRSLVITAIALFAIGSVGSMINILGSTVFHLRIPADMQGRAWGAFGMLA